MTITYATAKGATKRCEDCVYGYVSVWGHKLCGAPRPDGEPAFRVFAIRCVETKDRSMYIRKWWKFWRPR